MYQYKRDATAEMKQAKKLYPSYKWRVVKVKTKYGIRYDVKNSKGK